MGNCLDRQVVSMASDGEKLLVRKNQRKYSRNVFRRNQLRKKFSNSTHPSEVARFFSTRRKSLPQIARFPVVGSTVQVKIVMKKKQWEELVSHGNLQSLGADNKMLSHVIIRMQELGRKVGREKKMWSPLQRINEEI